MQVSVGELGTQEAGLGACRGRCVYATGPADETIVP
jgi:hypothetical protein